MSFWELEAASYGFGLDSYLTLPFSGLDYYASTNSGALSYSSIPYGFW